MPDRFEIGRMMNKTRRICFDISCSLFHPKTHGYLNTPDQARDYFREQNPQFWGATAFDSTTRKFRDFTDCRKLYDFISGADEIITFNGRVYDFIAIEKLTGAETMQGIWRKPHHDIVGWRLSGSLENAVKEMLPKLAPSFESAQTERFEKIRSRFEENTARALANTYRDTKFTYALFRLYESSGECGRTFFDTPILN